MKNHSIQANEPSDPSNFLHMYKLEVELDNGGINRYDIVTRHEALRLEDLDRQVGDAVTIIAQSRDHNQMLVIREFRPAVNNYVIAFPAGLIDESDDDFESAARRELKEETGYDIVSVDDVIRPTYTSPGMTNESVAFVYVTVDSLQSEVRINLEDTEDITAMWIDRSDAQSILQGSVALDQRTALELHSFIRHI